jgi:hypothetical protein
MSYDFNLYTAKPANLVPPLLSNKAQVVIEGPLVVEAEDLEPGELAVIGKRRTLYQVHLEGSLTEADWRDVEAWLNATLAASKGVLVDPQSGAFETGTRRGVLPQAGKAKRHSSWLCFWFKDGEGFHSKGFAETLATLAEAMPAALPTRFGEYEPLQGKVLAGDLAPVLAAFAEHPDLFLKAAPPFGEIHMSIPCAKLFSRYHPQHWIRRRFLLGRLDFEIKPALLDDKTARPGLLALFERLSLQLDVVYSEFTTPQYFTRGGWFWDGLPDSKPRAFCIGPDYRRVWPAANSLGRAVGNSHRLFVAARDGSGMPERPSDLLGPMDQPVGRDSVPELVRIFPFDYEYAPDKYLW